MVFYVPSRRESLPFDCYQITRVVQKVRRLLHIPNSHQCTALLITDRISEGGNAIASIRPFVSTLSLEPTDVDLELLLVSIVMTIVLGD